MTVESLAMNAVKLLADKVKHFFFSEAKTPKFGGIFL